MEKLLKQLKGVSIVPSANIRRYVEKLGRFISVGVVTCGIGTLAIFEGYNNYWDNVITRVQTVDFNILSHTLPTKLSYTIIKNQPKELQRTLDSNYSLFGLIVTDPSGQEVIASSGKKSSHHSWSAALDPKILQNYPYDLLLDPPPLFTQWNYKDPRTSERAASNLTSTGRVIGRVYYVRGVKPDFLNDFGKWLSNPISESSRAKTYTITILAYFAGGIAFWTIWEYLLYRKRVQKLEAEQVEATLKQQKDTLLLQLRQRISQINVLQAQWEQERTNSLSQAEELRSYNQKLQQEIAQVGTMISVPAVNSLQITQAELDKVKMEAESVRRSQQQQQQRIQELNQQLHIFQNQLAAARREGASSKLQSQIEEIRNAKSLAELGLQSFVNSENKFKTTIGSLENQLTSQRGIQEQLNKQLAMMKQSLAESQRREQESHRKAEATNQQLAVLIEEKKLLEEETGRHPLNEFEKAVFNCLDRNLPQNKEIRTQFDAGTGGENSKFIDFVLVLDRCILVLEAKSYKGLIEPVGEPRNTNWMCKPGSSSYKIRINASWGLNPYQQVKTYVDSLMLRTNTRNKRARIPVYGIVVFPANAEIASEIKSNIGGYYRITTLNNLLETVTELSNRSHQNSNNFNCQQIVDILTR